jgi:uncharacterized phage protein (TIGR02218 family)
MTYDAREKSRNAGAPRECFRFAVGSDTYLYTSSDGFVTIGGETYTPEPIRVSAPDFSQEDHAGTISVFVSRLNVVAQQFIAATPIAPVALVIYRAHEGEEGDPIVMFAGKVAGAKFDGSEAELICSPMSAALKRNVPRLLVQKECPWATYGVGCGLDRELFKDTGVLTAVSGYDLTADVFATRSDGWFSFGWIETLNGIKRFVVGHVGNTVTLQTPFIPNVSPGDTVYAFAGDDHLEATCRTKFNNIANFAGHSRVPIDNPYAVGLGHVGQG